jgi:hypothetical protein
VSPFSKPHYVSHRTGDHTSLVALVEKRFLATGRGKHHPALTLRDASADTLEDLFDFEHAPSLDATIPTARPSSSAGEGCHRGAPGRFGAPGSPTPISGGAPGAVPRRGVAARRAQRTYDLSTCARLRHADDGVNAR